MTFEEIIDRDGKLIYTNVGVSMMPLIREGKDLFVIDKIIDPLKFNDVVLFIRPNVIGRGKYVLHRIRRVNDDGTYYIIGDNCISGEIVKRENIIGILTSIQRGKNTVNVTDRKYLLFVKFWWMIYPMRVVYKRCRALLGKIKRKILV